MTKLTPEEIVHLSAVLAVQKLDTKSDLGEMCEQMQEGYLRIKEVFTDMNKDDTPLAITSFSPKGECKLFCVNGFSVFFTNRHLAGFTIIAG